MRWLIGILVGRFIHGNCRIFHGKLSSRGVTEAPMACVLLSNLNVLVRPILIILTLSVTLITLGFFLFVINAITLELTDYLMGDAFEISGFGMALLAAVQIAIVNVIISKTILKPSKQKK